MIRGLLLAGAVLVALVGLLSIMVDLNGVKAVRPVPGSSTAAGSSAPLFQQGFTSEARLPPVTSGSDHKADETAHIDEKALMRARALPPPGPPDMSIPLESVGPVPPHHSLAGAPVGWRSHSSDGGGVGGR